MKRGDVYDAGLDPTKGSEQAGRRSVIIVSRDAITNHMPIVIVVPCTSSRAGRMIYPSHVLLRAPEGGFTADSVALAEQVRALAKTRLNRRRGSLSAQALGQIDEALRIALDLRP